MNAASYQITFTTPLFSKGMYEDLAEVRPASIRGQLHWWFRALGGSHADEHAIFGGVHGGAAASKIVVRVSDIVGKTAKVATLPHKHGGEASPKISYLPGSRFTLHILGRLGGLDTRQQSLFERTLAAWLHMGSLGLRTTRGAGSFTFAPVKDTSQPQPSQTLADYEKRCHALIGTAPLRAVLLGREYSSAEAARHDCSDTVGGDAHPRDWPSLHDCSWPLGNVRTGRQKGQFPDAPKRKTSPLRFRIVSMGGAHRILALWDARTSVTHNSEADLHSAIQMLVAKKKEIGRQLAASGLVS